MALIKENSSNTSFFLKFYVKSDFDCLKVHKNKKKLYIVKNENVIIH